MRRLLARKEDPVDFAAGVDGWVCDSAVSVVVGTPDQDDLRLIEATEVALARAIAMARPGNKVGDLSAAIGATAREYGYTVNTQFGGHGVGRTMHGDPHISNDGRPGRGFALRWHGRASNTMACAWSSRTTMPARTGT